jgi:hypothetical protein
LKMMGKLAMLNMPLYLTWHKLTPVRAQEIRQSSTRS